MITSFLNVMSDAYLLLLTLGFDIDDEEAPVEHASKPAAAETVSSPSTEEID
jgi:hypothetical protein